MKQKNLQIKYSAIKLDALNLYLDKKKVTMQEELEDAVEKLYEKHVPNHVRDFLQMELDKQTKNNKPKPAPKKVETLSTSIQNPSYSQSNSSNS